MEVDEAVATAGDEEFGAELSDEEFGAELSDEELGELLVREITIDGMCGVY